MAQLFNFYQNLSGTGQYFPTSPIDFFTGVYYPPSLAAGKTVGFLWEGMGQKIVEQSLSFSGQKVDSNNQIVNFGITLAGSIMPLIRESGILTLTFTGKVISETPDTVTFTISHRGSGQADNKETVNFSTSVLSGVHQQDNKDTITFSTPIQSGVISQPYNEPVQFTTSFYGSFYPSSTPEFASISMQISSVDYSSTSRRLLLSSGTGMLITFSLSDVFYETAI